VNDDRAGGGRPDAFEVDPEVRVLVLASALERYFSAWGRA
jgi:hypothetical protein